MLPENEHGAFLIRDSESRHNDYSLSGKFVFHLVVMLIRHDSVCEILGRLLLIAFINFFGAVLIKIYDFLICLLMFDLRQSYSCVTKST